MLTLNKYGIVKKIVELEVVDSTNTYALDSGQVGLLVIASEQTSGRGRLGRSWFSPRGSNIYMTLTVDSTDSRLPLIAGVAVREAISGIVKGLAPIEIKWPNDILADGKKICGILCESRKFTAIGIGVNVNQRDWLPDLRGRVVSLADIVGGALDKDQVLEQILGSMDKWYSLFSRQGFDPVRKDFLLYGLLKGYTITTEEGLPGEIVDLDMQGHLLMNVWGSLREFVSGSIIVTK